MEKRGGGQSYTSKPQETQRTEEAMRRFDEEWDRGWRETTTKRMRDEILNKTVEHVNDGTFVPWWR